MDIALLYRYGVTRAGTRRAVDGHKECKLPMGWRWGGGILDNFATLFLLLAWIFWSAEFRKKNVFE